MIHKKQPRLRIVEYIWQFKFTRPGKYLVMAGVFVGALGMSSLETPVYLLFCILFMLGCVALIAGMIFRPRITITGRLPDKAVAGQLLQAHVTLTNIGRLPAYDVTAAFLTLPPSLKKDHRGSYVPSLPRRSSVAASVTLVPGKRGLYELPPLKAFSTFPLNLLRSGASQLKAPSLLVLPRFQSAESLSVPHVARYQPGGIVLTSRVGESLEYVGSREFHAGDSPRRIDFRAWARLGKPVMREYQEEYYCRLALVLDTYIAPRRWSYATGFPELEAAVSLTATIADALSREEYIVDIFAAGPRLYRFRAGRSKAHIDNVLEVLASVDACRTNPLATLTPALAEELSRISTVLCVFLDWDASRRELVRMAVEAGCAVKVYLVRNRPPTLFPDPSEEERMRRLSLADVENGVREL
jgi:uncharacterized protein (DUF58 family)